MRQYAPLPPEAFDTMTGLQSLRAMIAGDLPAPTIARVLNFTLIEATPGRALFEGERMKPPHPAGTVHGGWSAAILDSALGCSVHSTIEPGTDIQRWR